MEVSPMNKTVILNFIIDEAVLKLRNVSSNMMKIIHWMLKEKEVTVRKYDQRPLILNGSIKVEKGQLFKLKEMQKGVSNCALENNNQLTNLVFSSNRLIIYSISFYNSDPTEFDLADSLNIIPNT